MKWMMTWVLLLVPVLAQAQPIIVGKATVDEIAKAQDKLKDVSSTKPGISVGSQYSINEIEEAKKKLASLQQKTLTLSGDEFELVIPDPNRRSKSPLRYISLTNSSYWLVNVMAGEKVSIIGIRRGETEVKKHVLEPQPYSYSVVQGKRIDPAKPFSPELLVVVANSAKPDVDPPEEVDRLVINVTDGTPPAPGPGPKPPGPNPAPIPEQGLRVLIVHDPRVPLPYKQEMAMRASEVVDWLDRKCAKVDGQPEWRIYSVTTKMDNASKVWKDAMAKPRASVPWILISDGTKGHEGPLPDDTDALMKLLKSIGGD